MWTVLAAVRSRRWHRLVSICTVAFRVMRTMQLQRCLPVIFGSIPMSVAVITTRNMTVANTPVGSMAAEAIFVGTIAAAIDF